MTPAQKIAELKTLLAEAKEILMGVDPYDISHDPDDCIMCRITEALKDTTPMDDCCKEFNDLKEWLDDLAMESKFNDV